MLGESGNSYSAQCLAYRQIAAQCDLKVQQTKENQKKFLSLEAQIETYSGLVDSMEQVLQKIKPWMIDLLEYNAQKKKDALVAINTALSVANYIVPSSMSGIKFRIEGKEAWLETQLELMWIEWKDLGTRVLYRCTCAMLLCVPIHPFCSL